MRKISPVLVFLLFAPLLRANAWQTDTLPAAELPVVILSAQRSESKLAETPAAIVKTKPLAARRSTPEMLAATPGVFIQKTNHGGGSPFLRGLTGNQTLLLIDGIRLSNATFRYGPNQYLNTIDPFCIESMEVWKGGGSVGYGSDALGGTINVLTRQPAFASESKRGFSGRAIALWRSQDMENTVRAEGHFSGEKMAWTSGASFRQFGDLQGGKNTGRQTPSGYDEMAFDLKGKFRLGKNSILTLANQFLRQEDVPVFHKIQLEDFARNHISLQQRHLSYARLERNGKGMIEKISATASFQQSLEDREFRKNNSASLREESDKVSSLGASVQAMAVFNQFWRSTFGLESYHDRVGSSRRDTDLNTKLLTSKRGLYPDGATFTSAAAFWLHQWKAGKWDFSGGLRYNVFAVRVEDETLGKVTLNPSAFVWNAAALRHLSATDKLFFDFNTGFRAPNIDDLGSLGIVDFRYEIPTAQLKPEKSYHFELGWRHQSARWQAEAFVFRNELRDLITRVRVGADSIAGYPVYRKENLQQGFVQGVETNASFSLLRQLRLEGALAWQFGQNQTDDEPLRRIPPLFGHLALHLEKNRDKGSSSRFHWTATLECLAAGRQDRLAAGDKSDNRIPAGGTPGWKVINIFGELTLGRFSLRPGLWNIFDVDYRHHGSGINGMGRSISLSALVELP